MDRLTADEDFGKGGGLTVGILHQHSVGARVFNHTSGKEEGGCSVGVHVPLQLRKAGWEGNLGGRTWDCVSLSWSLGLVGGGRSFPVVQNRNNHVETVLFAKLFGQ